MSDVQEWLHPRPSGGGGGGGDWTITRHHTNNTGYFLYAKHPTHSLVLKRDGIQRETE